ncbi:MAG: universal stress protein [Blastocatellia bacterium]
MIDESNAWDADLIVVGSHGYRGLTKLWLGSVSQAVAAHAKCSVEIVRTREGHN